ncbi:CPBP family intramembrane glutamic endopeptidase [Microbacterium sp. Leaf320]|uniref:CPBP family intramembrane glutamic endopeptidase n=1 Tax=Microbacterium sp. Leaf320 TaxID=1736334 RepID=UPI0006F2BEE9|nr:type II CAAX endopeptidase family protein [Microbacterium sp. Leaf320]KQQ65326.1 hypothetical protein ASF63_15395 [Microbacterium sp. Leaf320]
MPTPSHTLPLPHVRPDRPLTSAIVAFLVVYGVVVAASGWVSDILPPTARDLAVLTGVAVTAAAGVWVFRDAFAAGWDQTTARPLHTLGLVAAGIVASTAVAVGTVLLLAVTGHTPTGLHTTGIVPVRDGAPLLTMILIGIVGPIVEELVFRETALARLGRRISPVLALVASSLLFGALHVRGVDDLPLLLDTATAGMVLGAFFLLARRNIVVPLTIHVLWSVASIVVWTRMAPPPLA